jgi:hypothetical protein
MMDKVYEFWYNECIYDSDAQCISLHKTREGAEKAMERRGLPTHAKAIGWASGFNGRAT